MGCFLFAGLLGLFVFAKRHHCGPRGGRWHRGRSWRRGNRRGSFLDRLAEELDLSPEQQKAIEEEMAELRSTTRPMKKEWKRSRGDLSDALRSDDFDAETMGEMFARHDDALRDLRKGVVGALAKIHAVLDPAQRARLAELLSSGLGPRWGGGPYRSWA